MSENEAIAERNKRAKHQRRIELIIGSVLLAPILGLMARELILMAVDHPRDAVIVLFVLMAFIGMWLLDDKDK